MVKNWNEARGLLELRGFDVFQQDRSSEEAAAEASSISKQTIAS